MSAVEHRFGRYGGQYVPETLMPALAELEEAWVKARQDQMDASVIRSWEEDPFIVRQWQRPTKGTPEVHEKAWVQ